MAFYRTLALAALLPIAAAQSRIVVSVTSVGDIQPSVTASISGPIQTGRACAQIQEAVKDSDADFPVVPAEVSRVFLGLLPFNPGAFRYRVGLETLGPVCLPGDETELLAATGSQSLASRAGLAPLSAVLMA
jgi:hypothetical protein